MNKKYDDDFFDDLDKTTDLLKAFKPHIETNDKIADLDDLYSEFNQKKNIESKKRNKTEEGITLKKRDNSSNNSNINNAFNKRKIEKKALPEQVKSRSNKIEPTQKRKKGAQTNINDIVNKMHTSVMKKKKDKNNKPSNIKDKAIMKKQNKKSLKFNGFEITFCAFSFLFILGCIAIYSSRLLKYYRVYNPKSEGGQSLMLVTTAIGKNSSLVYNGDGLYMNSGEYTYKGSNVDNYLIFSNMRWRILKTNNDGTIDLVMDDYINTLSWANRPKAYIESDIHKYLNNYFIKYLDKSYLAPTTICKDEVNDLKKFTCNNKNEDNYVRLLSVNEFLNSKTDSTFISDENSTLWLNTISDSKTWQINGNNLSLADPTRALGIKPVIKLKSGVALLKGDGSLNNPFYIQEDDNNIHIGNYVILGKDKYIVYDIDDDVLSLVLDTKLEKTYRYDLNSNTFNPNVNTSLAYYLNNDFYNSLSYKDLIIESKWNVGNYVMSYEDITSKQVSAKIGLYDVMSLKFNNDIQDYFLLNGINNGVYLYGRESIGTKPAINHGIRPALRIKNNKIINGDGTKDSPYILEG